LTSDEHRERRTHALRSGALALGVVGAAAAAIWLASAGWRALLKAPEFALSRVEVVGNQRLSSDEVRQAADLRPGTSLFRLDLDRATRALAESSWIRRASLARHWPSVVAITLEERRPAAFVDLGGRLYVADDRGEVFKRASPQDGLDLPLLSGLSRSRFVSDRSAVQQQILSALTLLSDLGPAGQREASEVHRDDELGMTLYLGPEALAVHLGDSDFEGKLDRFARARSELDRRHLKVSSISLDDRVHPERVSFTLAGSERTPFH
jgi:cell division protein FtsQ